MKSQRAPAQKNTNTKTRKTKRRKPYQNTIDPLGQLLSTNQRGGNRY